MHASKQLVKSLRRFRHDLAPATSAQDIWPQLCLAAACLFFVDVLVRRVHLRLAPIGAVAASAYRRVIRRRAAAPPVAAVLARLQSSKAGISEKIAQQRMGAEVRTESLADIESATSTAEDVAVAAAEPSEKSAAESYTDRLLKAKSAVWDSRK